MHGSARGAGVGALLLLSLAAPVAAQTIGVTLETGGRAAFPPLGSLAMGQTFVAPGGNRLTAFSFKYSSPDDLVFRLAEWNAGSLTTPYLFSEAVGPTTGSQWVSFGLPAAGIPITPGATYLAFLELDAGEEITLADNELDSYAQGLFTWGDLGTLDWYPSDRTVDAVFQATFASVAPEPASLALLGTGLLGLGLVGRRRRKARG